MELTWRTPHEAVADPSGKPEPLLLWMHYHPGWTAGKRAKLTSNPAGWTEVTDIRNPDLPLVIRWEGTVWQRRGEFLSLLGLVASTAGILYLAWRRREGDQALTSKTVRRNEKEHEEQPHLRQDLTGVWGLVGLVLILMLGRYSLTWLNTFPFLYHSPPGRLAFATEGEPTTLGDAKSGLVTLLGWKLLSGPEPKPGEIVIVRLFWQPHEQINEELWSNLHLYTPALQRSWAVESHGVTRPPSTVWSPDKYYMETIYLKIPIDVPPIPYTLVAGLVSSSGKRLQVPGSTDGLLPLRMLRVSPLRSGFLQRERPSASTHAGTSDNLRLQGYDLLAERGEATLRLFWDAEGAVARNWVTYIHLHDQMGERIAQYDGPPLAGLKPTSEWQKRSLYIDRRQITLPANLPAGDFLFRLGLYHRETGERLPFLPDVDDRNHFQDGQLLVPLTISAE